jgi:AcrR family transcriptional regulator
MRPLSLPVKQARSQATVDKLLDAAQALLASGELAAVTVPNIAKRAGVSVGVVYRRFPNKDALLRAVFERYFDRARESNAHGVDLQWWEGISLPDITRSIVDSVVAGHLRHRAFLRAMHDYKQHADARFRRRLDDLNAESTRAVADLLLTRRDEMHHPDPERGVRLALFMVAASMRAVTRVDESALHPFGIVEGKLGAELTRAVLGYLGVKGQPTPRLDERQPASGSGG